MNITVRLYEELNDVKPFEERKHTFSRTLPKGSSVSVLLTDLGIPLERVELAMVNGRSVQPSHTLRDNDYVSFFPVFESMDVSPLVRFRNFPLRSLKFLTDPTVGALGEKLGNRGYDVRQESSMEDLELVRIAGREDRILLSVRTQLARASGVTRALTVPDGDSEAQLAYLLSRLHLE